MFLGLRLPQSSSPRQQFRVRWQESGAGSRPGVPLKQANSESTRGLAAEGRPSPACPFENPRRTEEKPPKCSLGWVTWFAAPPAAEPAAGAVTAAAAASGGEKSRGAAAVEIADLRVDYADTLAVDDLSLRVEPGQIFGLVGPNGAGKTTTFQVITTLLQPTYGRVSLCGEDVLARPQSAHRLLGSMPDLAPVPSDLTVKEFLELFGRAHGLRGAALSRRIDECLEAVELTDRRRSWCRNLSRGMMQRVVLAKTLLHRPRVLVLDEPASGMDPRSRNALKVALRQLAGEGVAVLVSSHILTELAELCTHLGLLRRGRLLRTGAVAEVLQAGDARRRLVLRVRADADAATESWLRAFPGVSDHDRHGPGQWELDFLGDDEAQIQLLAAAVGDGLPVLGLLARHASLEEVVLALDQADPQREVSTAGGGRG